jgi:hypothetical protein
MSGLFSNLGFPALSRLIVFPLSWISILLLFLAAVVASPTCHSFLWGRPAVVYLLKSPRPRHETKSCAMMLTRPRLLAAASMLLGAASARPPLVTLVLEARTPAATDPWVSVDTSGQPVTVTPVVTVVDGATTTISAAPNDLTATVVTRTDYAEVTTSTGTAPPEPTATGKDGTGSFLVCRNAEGEYAPFCQPSYNSSLFPGTTYYGMRTSNHSPIGSSTFRPLSNLSLI